LPALEGVRLLACRTTRGYTDALIMNYAALILVDADAPDWQRWTHAPKSSPATRRIPILALMNAPNEERTAHALKNGADVVLSVGTFLHDAPAIVRQYARVVDEAQQAELACDCAEPLPARAEQAIAKFNAGEYYAQHDLLELEWAESTRPVRDLYRAILQVGVAYYQIERGNYRGALKMLQRSVQWLLILPDVCQTVDIADLRANAFAVLAELQRVGEAGIAQFDRTLIKPVRRAT
jgi:predicted metal-dependent hydrolase